MNCYTDEVGTKFYYLGSIKDHKMHFTYSSINELDYIVSVNNDSIRYLIHRENGPAIIFADGSEWWVFNGKSHREDGAAFSAALGKFKQWWYHGEQIHCKDNEEFLKIIKMKAFI